MNRSGESSSASRAGVDEGLLLDVTTALERLETSLREGKDINLDTQKRSTLLGLVSRLQTGLISPDKISPEENDLSSPEEPPRPDRRPFGGARFNKRRQRQNRHTVGVSQEELADARRFMEDMIMRENHSSTGTPEVTAALPPEYPYNLQKQASTGSLLTSEPSTPVLHRPKEFVKELPVVMRDRKPKFKFMRQSLSLDASLHDELPPPPPSRQYNESISVDSSQVRQSIQDAVYRAKNKKLDDMIRVEEKNLHNKVKHSSKKNQKNARSRTPPASAAQRLLELATASDDNSRFSKKMKMKRANTIDIPKPVKIALTESDDALSESEYFKETAQKPAQTQGLKTAIRVGDKKTPGKTVVPVFQPKTENDHKFLAFIHKQTTNSGLSWAKPEEPIEPKQKQHNWSNKFGNIKNTFENVPKQSLGGMKVTSPVGGNSARNFWRTTESTTVHQKPLLPTPPPKMKGVSTKIEKFEAPTAAVCLPKPIPVNKFSHAPMSAFKPPPSKKIQQIPPFKPIAPAAIPHTVQLPQPTNTTVKQLTNGFMDERLPGKQSLIKPANSPTRNLANYQFYTPNNHQSPTNILPWTAKVVPEKRVLNLAAQKFEAPPHPPAARKLSPRSQSMKYRNTETTYSTPPVNPSRLLEKRPSLPSKDYTFPVNSETYQNTQMNENIFQVNPSYIAPRSKFPGSVPNLTDINYDQKMSSYTVTDYTPPGCVSTCVPQWTVDSPRDSITNPNAEPLVLTCDRPVYSPNSPTKQETLKIFDYPSPVSVSPAKSSNDATDDWDDDQDLTDSTEYKAVSSRVMTGPICHSAVTVSHKTSRLGDEDPHGKGSVAAKSLHTVLKTIKSPARSPVKGRKSPPSPLVIKQPQIVETPATPPSHIIYNNVNNIQRSNHAAPHALSKSDSWHQICANVNRQPSPKQFIADNRGLQRAKSNHNLLSVPKQYEAGIARDQVTEKQKTVAAYFSGQKSPTNTISKRTTTINRVRTSSKASINNQNPSSGLARSQTMPHMSLAQMHLLDEDNVEDAFEDLFNSSLS